MDNTTSLATNSGEGLPALSPRVVGLPLIPAELLRTPVRGVGATFAAPVPGRELPSSGLEAPLEEGGSPSSRRWRQTSGQQTTSRRA